MTRHMLIAVCVFALAACKTETRPSTIEVSGTLFYLERIALPPDALVQVDLRDVSRADAPAKILVMQAISGQVGPPFAFKLSAPTAEIDPQAKLALFATIRADQRVMFVTDRLVPVPPEGAAGMQVRMVIVTQASSTPDQWLGKWIGPEGTYLLLVKEGDGYTVEIQSLDGPASYVGSPAGERIDFTRNGIPESIHAGDGEATGMKWLLDKKNCLIVKTGEGFCRA